MPVMEVGGGNKMCTYVRLVTCMALIRDRFRYRHLAGDVVVAEVELLQRGEAAELPGDPAAEAVLREAEHAQAPQAAQRRRYEAGEAGVGLEHDLLERGRRREQRGRQLNGGLGGAKAAEDGERPEVR
jgi:hypothetical protein